MALTPTRLVGPVAVGDRYMTVTEIAFDNSFAAGGESLTKGDLGFASTTDPEFHAICSMAGGYSLDYDYTNSKLLAYVSSTGAADVAADTKDLSLLTARVTAYGKYRA